MSAPDTFARLEGEPQIPSLMARPAASSHKAVIAGGILFLSLVGVLGFAGSRYFGSKTRPPVAAAEVASATTPRIRFQDPAPAMPANPPLGAAANLPVEPMSGPAEAIRLVNQSRVPSIEADRGAGEGASAQAYPATAIPVRGTAGASDRASRPPVPAGDESPFASGAPAGAGPAGVAGNVGGVAPGMTSDAQANMRRYQAQLAGMLGQLQGLTDRATGAGTGAGSTDLAAALQLPTSAVLQAGNPVLFGSLERSATPTVVARLLGDRRLTLPKGVLFTCSLKTRIISATSGFVACQVQRNVFSDDGKVVLAERGSHLDGEYRVVQVRPGVTRIPVLWTRLRTPHGVTVDLVSPATGALGESGIGGYVDNRWPERIGAAMLVSLIDDVVKIVATDANPGTDSTTVLLPSTTAAGSKLAEKVLEATINIPPLLYQNQGSIVGVYVARDVDFSKVYALEPR